MMRIHFYGKLADMLGRELEFPVNGDCTVAELRGRLAAAHPHAADSLNNKRVRACVSDSIVADSHVLVPGDGIEFLSPVSGG